MVTLKSLFAGGLVVLLLAVALRPVHAANARDPNIRFRQMQIEAHIIKFAASRVDQPAVGNGQCTDLVVKALEAAGGKTPDFSKQPWVWGLRWLSLGKGGFRPITPSRGDIIQFKNCVFEGKNSRNMLGIPNHTAIVENVVGKQVTLLHQNVDGDVSKSRVRRQTIDFSTYKSGTYVRYCPLPK